MDPNMTPETAATQTDDFVDALEKDWHANHLKFSATATGVVARVTRLSYRIEQRVERNLSRFDLTRGEFEVLAVLLRSSSESVTPKKIQERVLITSGGLSNRIKALETKGLITRSQDTTDRRAVVVTLTEKGKSIATRAAQSHLNVEREILQGMPMEDAARLAELLKKLLVLQESSLQQD